MSKQWQGPYDNPFKAACKALDADNVDTSEFSTFGLWGCVGEYPFHTQAGDFIEDLCAFLASQWNIVVQHREDGFYAMRDEE